MDFTTDNKYLPPDTGNGQPSGRTKERVFHTVTACVRCRQVSSAARVNSLYRTDVCQRKTRCDPALPRCEPCDRANAHCEYFDSNRNATIPRTYITSLQDTVRKLSAELKALEVDEDQDADHESMAKAGGLVKFNEKDDSRFLGPSSGIAITRFVMDFAKQNTERKTIRDVVPTHQAAEAKQKFDLESAKPTSKVYPLISSVAAPTLPHRELMERLIDIYVVKAQYALPLLHEPSFRNEVDLVYNGSTDPTLNFQVRLVIAISMQKLDTQYAGLADSYYLAALPYLAAAVNKKDLATLQCFALLAQYSLLTPTRTAAYWVVGFAAKLCQELGLCDEQTIEKPPSGLHPNVLEIDMRRRLFWIITSMEYGLSHSLGRPSAFGVSVDNINVKFFELCDDKYITAEGLLPGHHPIMKKCISIHFLRMRLLQAEIRRTLYLKKRPTPNNENDPWFASMLIRIDDWVRDSPRNDEGSGLSESWFTGRRNTMIIFMYRPSPQIPTPSFFAAQQCYDAAIYNIRLFKKQVEERLIDITWIFTQAFCMALNTVLWTLSMPGIRKMHPIEEVQNLVQDALIGIALCAERWPGVTSALQLYGNLVPGCLKAYDGDKVVRSPGTASVQDFNSATSQTAPSPASTGTVSYYGPQSPQSFTASYQPGLQPTHSLKSDQNQNHSSFSGQPPFTNNVTPQSNMHYGSTSPPVRSHQSPYGSPEYNDQTQQYPFPTSRQSLQSWDATTSAPGVGPGFLAFSDLSSDNQSWLASFGDVYSDYLGQTHGAAPSYQMESLGEQDQLELMASLEQSQLPDISPMAGTAQTYYNPFLP